MEVIVSPSVKGSKDPVEQLDSSKLAKSLHVSDKEMPVYGHVWKELKDGLSSLIRSIRKLRLSSTVTHVVEKLPKQLEKINKGVKHLSKSLKEGSINENTLELNKVNLKKISTILHHVKWKTSNVPESEANKWRSKLSTVQSEIETLLKECDEHEIKQAQTKMVLLLDILIKSISSKPPEGDINLYNKNIKTIADLMESFDRAKNENDYNEILNIAKKAKDSINKYNAKEKNEPLYKSTAASLQELIDKLEAYNIQKQQKEANQDKIKKKITARLDILKKSIEKATILGERISSGIGEKDRVPYKDNIQTILELFDKYESIPELAEAVIKSINNYNALTTNKLYVITARDLGQLLDELKRNET